MFIFSNLTPEEPQEARSNVLWDVVLTSAKTGSKVHALLIMRKDAKSSKFVAEANAWTDQVKYTGVLSAKIFPHPLVS